MATAETAMAVTSREDGALESRMTRKRSCPVWGGGAGKVPQSNSPTPYSTNALSRKLWTALHALDGYLTSQSAWLVNYAERHRAGLQVCTAITEGTANFLVNRRMNKSQQMRWSRRGADLLLHVRCAVYNGALGSGFGQKFQPANDPCPTIATAA